MAEFASLQCSGAPALPSPFPSACFICSLHSYAVSGFSFTRLPRALEKEEYPETHNYLLFSRLNASQSTMKTVAHSAIRVNLCLSFTGQMTKQEPMSHKRGHITQQQSIHSQRLHTCPPCEAWKPRSGFASRGRRLASASRRFGGGCRSPAATTPSIRSGRLLLARLAGCAPAPSRLGLFGVLSVVGLDGRQAGGSRLPATAPCRGSDCRCRQKYRSN